MAKNYYSEIHLHVVCKRGFNGGEAGLMSLGPGVTL